MPVVEIRPQDVIPFDKYRGVKMPTPRKDIRVSPPVDEPAMKQRMEELVAQGIPNDQILTTIQQEFGGAEETPKKVIEISPQDVIPLAPPKPAWQPKQVTVTPPWEARHPYITAAIETADFPGLRYLLPTAREEFLKRYRAAPSLKPGAEVLEPGTKEDILREAAAEEAQKLLGWTVLPKVIGAAAKFIAPPLGRLAGRVLPKAVTEWATKPRHIFPPKVPPAPPPTMPPMFARQIMPKLTIGGRFDRDEARQITKWLFENPEQPLAKAIKATKGPLNEAQFTALEKQLKSMPLPPPKVRGAKPLAMEETYDTVKAKLYHYSGGQPVGFTFTDEALRAAGIKGDINKLVKAGILEENEAGLFGLASRPLKPPKPRGGGGAAAGGEGGGEINLAPAVGKQAKVRAKPKGFVQSKVDDFLKTAAPGARGPLARFAALSIRDNAARYALEALRTNHVLGGARKVLSRMSPEEGLQFIYAVEEGNRVTNPILNNAINLLHPIHEKTKNELISAGKGHVVTWLDNYYPHIFKAPEAARSAVRDFIKGARARMRELPPALHERVIPTMREAVERYGLKPYYSNPMDAILAKHHEVSKYVTKLKALNELKELGFTEKNLPEEVQRIFNNYLSPGLQVHPSFRAFRNLGNLQVAVQLGLSGFHAGFTTADVISSYLSAATYELARGNFGRAAKMAATTLISPPLNVLKGHKLFMHAIDPARYPELAPILEGIIKGGGRVKMDAWYRLNATKKMMDGLRRGGFFGYLSAVTNAPAATIEATMYPILEWLVPRQKLGLMSRLIENEMIRKPNMSLYEMRNIAAKISDSVDNRLGQLAYDNLFWNKTFKDIMLSMWRSVGWNLGTWREFLGGGVDTARFVKNVAMRRDAEFTHRMSYMMTLPAVVGLAGAITQYLAIGEAPSAESVSSFARDIYFPRIDKEGNRISYPTYMKDLAMIGLGYHTIPSVIASKLHPTLTMLADIWRNSDFFNVQIRHKGDTAEQQLKDIANYFFEDISTPIAISTMQKMKQRGGKGLLPYAPQVGILPAPAAVSRAPEEELATELVGKLSPPRSRTQAKRLRKLRELTTRYKRGEDVTSEAADLYRTGEISRKELASFAKAPVDTFVLDVSKLPLHDALNIYRMASPANKAKIEQVIQKKRLSRAKQYPYEQAEGSE